MSGKIFEWTCQHLEARTDLNRLEARGTVRLALKTAGFDPRRVSATEMSAVLRKVMPGELDSRRVDDAELICERLAEEAASLHDDPERSETPEQIFARLGR